MLAGIFALVYNDYDLLYTVNNLARLCMFGPQQLDGSARGTGKDFDPG
jgi:hypothetical protein